VHLLDRPAQVHLAVPLGRSPSTSSIRPSSAVVLHRSATIAPGQCPERPVVPEVVAAATILRCLEPLAAVVAMDSVLNRGVCSRSDIEAELAGPGRAKAIGVLRRCDPRSESVLESVARVTLRDAGLAVECNVSIPRVGRVDLLVEGRLVVELDGFEHHGSRRAFVEDRRRDRALVALGLLVLRFTYDDVLASPDTVVRAVRCALEAPHRRSAGL
jgi:very-short-patch-repair endonuclease